MGIRGHLRCRGVTEAEASAAGHDLVRRCRRHDVKARKVLVGFHVGTGPGAVALARIGRLAMRNAQQEALARDWGEQCRHSKPSPRPSVYWWNRFWFQKCSTSTVTNDRCGSRRNGGDEARLRGGVWVGRCLATVSAHARFHGRGR
jgi:hypothetical protein